MNHWKSVFLCSLLGAASLPAAACFTVYDSSNSIVYNAQTAPVDMSQPLHETLPKRFPGGHMVITESKDCPVVQPNPLVAARGSGSPLLTDRETAESLNVPHTILPSGAALVRSPARLPPSRPVLTGPGSKSSAIPAGSALAMGKPRPLSNGKTVITEMHNPPMVAVQVGNSLTLTDR